MPVFCQKDPQKLSFYRCIHEKVREELTRRENILNDVTHRALKATKPIESTPAEYM